MTFQPFSARQGYRPEDNQNTARKDARTEVREAILNLAERLGMSLLDMRGEICRVLLVRPGPNNELPPHVWDEVKSLMDGAHRDKVYDIAESFHAKLLSSNPHAAIEFERQLNEFFLKNGIDWELRNGQITDRNSEVFSDGTNETPQTPKQTNSHRAVNGTGETQIEHLPYMVKKYDVALSFAGEQRVFVEEVARYLVSSGLRVFYDDFEQNLLWGNPLLEFIQDVYTNSRFVVLFISEEYCSKGWPKLEASHSIWAALIERKTTILPVRFDRSVLPGLPEELGYIKVEKFPTSALIAKEICEKVGVQPLAGKESNSPPPQAKQFAGEVAFNYSNYNGAYMIGSGKARFETKWSKASDTSIYLLNDPPSIRGVAVVGRNVRSIREVNNAESLNYTSRCRTVHLNQIAVLKNREGFFAAIRVLGIKDDSRKDDRDEVRFQYVIQEDGSDNFSNIDERVWSNHTASM